MEETGAELWLAVAALVVIALFVDQRLFARDGQPSFRTSTYWSLGWLGLAAVVGVAMFAFVGSEEGSSYTAVYLLERSLSLDNVFVFLLLFGFFAIPVEHRPRLLLWGIVLALVMRGLAILGGIALLESVSFLTYVLGALLVLLGLRLLRSGGGDVDPTQSRALVALRRVVPVADDDGSGAFFVRRDGRRHATPVLLCLLAIVIADVTFAVDSVPAALAVSQDAFVVWTANALALVGLRSLFLLVEVLVQRFRYLGQTVAVLLTFVGVKLLLEEWLHIGPLATVGIVVGVLAAGIVLSLLAERRDPAPPDEREARRPPRCPPALGSGADLPRVTLPAR